MKNIFATVAAAGAGLAMLTGCGQSNEWTVKGNIANSEGHDYVVEAYDNGWWYMLDTLKVKPSGDFRYSHEAAGFPDVYRLRSGEATIYFPIDSIETVIINSNGDTFGTDYRLEGSEQAVAMMNADSIIGVMIEAGGLGSDAEAEAKRRLSQLILSDPSSIVAYYLINRKIGGRSVFNASDNADLRIVGAVANAFNSFRPADPRTAYLKRLFLENRRNLHPRDSLRTVIANEITAPEILLYDNHGKQQSLNSLSEQGKPVLLNFTMYAAQESPAFNMLLKSVYDKFHSSGLEIYQVAIDDNEYQWKQTADNLPWITVLNDAADSDRVILDYNVGSIPTIFILDRNGNVVERVTDLGNLESLIGKYI